MSGGPAKAMRVAVYVPARRVPAWVGDVIGRLSATVGVTVVTVSVGTESGRRPGERNEVHARLSRHTEAGLPELLKLVLAVDRRAFGRRLGALRPIDAAAAARGAGAAWSQDPAPPADCDVVVGIGVRPPLSQGLTAAWWLRDVPLGPAGGASAWRAVVGAVVAGDGSVRFALEERTWPRPSCARGAEPEQTARREVRVAVCPVHPSSPHLTAAEMGVAATSFVTERVARHAAAMSGAGPGPGDTSPVKPVASAGDAGADDTEEDRTTDLRRPSDDGEAGSPDAGRPIGLLQVARWAARVAASNLREACFREQWFVLVGRDDLDARHEPRRLVPSPADLRALVPPHDRFWADPQLAVSKGDPEAPEARQAFLFVEELVYSSGRGRIVAVPLSGEGLPTGRPVVAMAAAHHLSYPFVVQDDAGDRDHGPGVEDHGRGGRERGLRGPDHGPGAAARGAVGAPCLLPEQAATEMLTLYAADRLPDRWSVRSILLEGVRAVDGTLVFHDGRWWLFACVKTGSPLDLAYELRAYHAASLDDGGWQAHAGNPLLVDVRRARPAGPFFRRAGRLYRPAQDGGRGYGGGIVIHEVLRLTPDEYAERPVARLDPDWAPGLRGTHTLCRGGGLVALDAARLVPRRPCCRLRSGTYPGTFAEQERR
jgi:hypothetical protein